MANNNKEKNTQDFSGVRSTVAVFIIVALSVLSNALFAYISWWALLINLVIVLLGLLFLSKHNDKEERKLEELEKLICKMRDTSDALGNTASAIIASSDIYSYVCDSTALKELEGSVGDVKETDKHPQIYVQSTKFYLEARDDFSRMIINNLRKGVVYCYLIPIFRNPSRYKPFNNMVLSWWEKYSCFLQSKEQCDDLVRSISKTWDSKYISFLNKAKDLWDSSYTPHSYHRWQSLIEEVSNHFISLIKAYLAEEHTFYTVTALYQFGDNKWKAIIKLPTEYMGGKSTDYYSFVVFGDHFAESDNLFVSNFRENFNEDRRFDMEELRRMISEYNGVELYAKHDC